MKPSAYTGRLAPAPTGALHLGNARTFLVAWLRARSAGGRLVLRLEDLDHPKVKPAAREGVFEDLRWLGLDWDDGADTNPSLIQSNRAARYREVFDILLSRGWVYPCRCTRRELEAVQSAPHDGDDAPEYRYPNRCRPSPGLPALDNNPGAGESPVRAWRFRLDALPGLSRQSFMDAFHGPRQGDLEAWSGDFAVARVPDHVAYQLAVVIDDHDAGITEVVRGDDLLPSTERQLALYQALDWTPPAFCHLPLVIGPDRKRLAKRHGDTRLSRFREAGIAPERLVGWLAQTLGINHLPDNLRPADLLADFRLERIPRERIVASDVLVHQLISETSKNR